jgi:enolase-phosphatase E1
VALANPEQVRVVLLDIEGTTTPVDFVYKTLFPYASRKVEAFLRDHGHEPEIVALIEDLRRQNAADTVRDFGLPAWDSESAEAERSSAAAYVRWLIDQDSKCTPLKTLQGRIWQNGFASGELHGEVYADVPPALVRWRKQGRIICIYSSGSVLAQQNLFRTVISGDLTPYISGFFDTQTGVKTASESYLRIAASLSHAAGQCLFMSDAGKEIDAARAAGMQAILCDRSASYSGKDASGEVILNFDQIFPA